MARDDDLRAPLLRTLVLAALVALGSSAPDWATAQLLPGRPITVIIPFMSGASADTFQRLVAKKVTENTGQLIVVESRPGAGGTVGALAVKQAPPDGHTLLQGNSGTHAVNASLYAALPYDPIRDFQPITLMWTFPHLLIVPADSPATSVSDLAALAKSRPGGLSFASQGTGSSGHLLGETFKMTTKGAEMIHVPYHGAAPGMLDVATGRVDFFFVSYASALPFIQAAKVRPLAIASAKRLPVLPNLPTMAELGFHGFELDAWFGLLAPAGTSEDVIATLNAAFVRAVKDPEVVRQMEDQGTEPVTDTPEEFAAFIAAEVKRWGKIVRALGIKAD
jgi:tripartite-type tricarboxylate transporter receptor subunit TctC